MSGKPHKGPLHCCSGWLSSLLWQKVELLEGGDTHRGIYKQAVLGWAGWVCQSLLLLSHSTSYWLRSECCVIRSRPAGWDTGYSFSVSVWELAWHRWLGADTWLTPLFLFGTLKSNFWPCSMGIFWWLFIFTRDICLPKLNYSGMTSPWPLFPKTYLGI